jgi:hypothetical protein
VCREAETLFLAARSSKSSRTAVARGGSGGKSGVLRSVALVVLLIGAVTLWVMAVDPGSHSERRDWDRFGRGPARAGGLCA